MWTVVYTAYDNEALHSICELLDKNGIICRIGSAADNSSEDGAYYNVLVPSAEVSAAHALILDDEL